MPWPPQHFLRSLSTFSSNSHHHLSLLACDGPLSLLSSFPCPSCVGKASALSHTPAEAGSTAFPHRTRNPGQVSRGRLRACASPHACLPPPHSQASCSHCSGLSAPRGLVASAKERAPSGAALAEDKGKPVHKQPGSLLPRGASPGLVAPGLSGVPTGAESSSPTVATGSWVSSFP